MANPSTFSGRVFHGTFWVSSGAVAVRVIGFLVSIFLLRTFSLHDYGTYQLVLAAGGLFALLMLQGIDEVIVAAGAKSLGEENAAHARDLMRGYWLFKLITGVAVWAVVLFGSSLLGRWYGSDILQLLHLYAWVFLLIPFERAIQFYFSIRRQFARSSIYTFVQEFAKGACIVLFVWYFHLGISGALLAYIVGMAVPILVFGFGPLVEMLVDRRLASVKPFLDLLRAQGLWVILQRLIRQGEKNIRPFIIGALLGLDAVAIFSFADKIYSYLAGLFPLDDVLMPSIASESNNRERLQRILERGIKYTVPFYAAAAIGVGLVSPWVIRFFFPQYQPALPVEYVVLCYIPFVGLAYLLTSFFVSHQEQASLFRIICIRFVLFLVLLPVSIRLFGVLGIGVEYALTLMAYNILRYHVLQKKYPELHVSFSSLFRIDAYDRAVYRRLAQKLNPFKKLPAGNR